MADLGSLGAIFGGLAGGLAQGAEAGISLSQKQQQIELQQSQQGVSLLNAMVNMRKMPQDLRKIVMPSIFKQYEKLLGTSLPEGLYKLSTQADDNTWPHVVDGLVKTLPPTFDRESIAAWGKKIDDPAEQARFMEYLRKTRQGEETADIRRTAPGRIGSTTVYERDEYGNIRARTVTPGQSATPSTAAPPSKIPPAPITPPQPGVAQTDDQKATEVTGLLDSANRGPQFVQSGIPRTGTFAPPSPALEGPQQAQATGEKQNYLDTLPPSYKEFVRAIGEYRAAPPTGRGPYQTKVLSDVAKAFPEYDAKNYGQYVKALKDFSASGEAGRNLRSLATAEGHMGTMVEMFRALKNGDIPAANAITNLVRRNLGRPEVTNADAARVALSDELKRVFTVVGVGTEADRKLWFETLSTAKSPEQARGVLKTMADLLDSRVSALEKQWKDNGPPGRPMPGYPTEDVVKARAAVKQYFEEGKPKSTAPQTGGPKVGTIDGGYRFKGGNPADPKNWEKVQ